MAHASARSDPDRNGQLRLGTTLGEPIEEIRRGDVVWFLPGEKHWHGATPTTAMTHIAIQEKLDGKVVDWMEQVSDEQYQAVQR
jgi:quercetin dioxygenase-like cupin family protein